MFYRVVRFIVKILVYVVYRPKIYGKENKIEKGRVVVVANHKNNFDCAFLAVIFKRTLHFLAKDELTTGKLGWAFRRMQVIPVNRREKDHNAIPMAVKHLNKDEVVAIFPEGTFNKTDKLIMDFKIGAVKMAHDSDSYILPVALVSNYKLSWKRFVIRIGKPYKIESDDLEKENKKLMKKVTDLLKEGE